MPQDRTVTELLSTGEDNAVAISGTQREALTYTGLREQVDETVARLNEIGIGRNDRVAIVLPNGPEMATAFVSIAAGATTAPLNPAYRKRSLSSIYAISNRRPYWWKREVNLPQLRRRMRSKFGCSS